MNRDETEGFIRKLYAARVGADMEALSQAFADDAKFQNAGSPEHSMLAALAEGHESVMALIQTVVDSFELENFTILDLVIEGNKVAVRWRATVHRIGAGETFETEVADFIEIRDGKVASFIEFLDTALAG